MKKAAILTTIFLLTVAISKVYGQTDSASLRSAPADSVIYTCTMHPEVISNKPGTCPKCGMALVQKTSSSQHQMNMMMCPMHGMVDGNHKHNEQKKNNNKMFKRMGIAMGIMMVTGITLMIVRGGH